MPTAEEYYMSDRGEPNTWAQLDAEETRKLLGLKMYWVKVDGKSEQGGEVLAWQDLQKECPRLAGFSWFKILE